MEQRTLVLVKPDGVERGLIGEVVSRLETKQLRLLDMRMLSLDRAMAESHYAEHTDKPFFNELVDFITSGPIVAMAVEGEDAVAVVRTLMGTTDPKDASPGTIRGDFGLKITENIVHGSDSEVSAKRELELFFPELT